MIEYVRGESIFDSPAKWRVSPVNTRGASGKGLARAFRDRYPAAEAKYQAACRAGRFDVGMVLVEAAGDGTHVVFLATKRDWRNASQLEWIDQGVAALRAAMDAGTIPDVAIPALGCGLGGLAWSDVRQIIERHLGNAPGRIIVYGEGPAPEDRTGTAE